MILSKLFAFAGLCAVLAPLPLQNTSADTAEGAEILRRIVVDVLDEAFDRTERDEVSGNKLERRERFGVVTTLWAHRDTVQHSRVFHMPGAGLFIALDAALPVVSREAEKDEPGRGKETRDDEWERARREVRGGGSTLEPGVFVLGNRRLKMTEIDPRAIDQVIDLVLRSLARHAGRIEGLGSQETITVALRLSGRAQVWSDESLEGDDKYRSETHVWTDDEDELGQGAFSFVLAGGSSAREQNLVIRVGLSDLAGFADSGLDHLRHRAQINRY